MTEIRMTRLDEEGQPTGDMQVFTSATLSWDYPNTSPFAEADCVPVSVPRHVSFSARIVRTKELDRVLFGPLSQHQRRYWKHRNRIKHVPKRHRKHGRVGVFR